MQTQTFKPGPQYLTRLRLVMTIVALCVLLSSALIVVPVALGGEARTAAPILAVVFVGLDMLWYVPGLLLAGPYFRSLRYEVQDDEVIVRAGIWTQSVKHVPYRTVTNLTVKRDVLDRLLGIGTLNIQTAGMSGTNAAEESLVGLTNVQAIYGIVAGELRRFRGGMAPTAAEAERDVVAPAGDALGAILDEVRAIRRALEIRQPYS